MKIAGKTVIVTGGASGLGQATIELFNQNGANVVIADLNEEKGKALEDSLGARALFVKTNIGETEDVVNVCKAAKEKFGSIHVLVNCAGIGAPGKIVGKEGPYDIERFKKVVSVNLVGTFNMTAHAAYEMTKNEPEDDERGVVIHISSIAAYEGQMGQSAYATTKAGLIGMTLPMARDLARDGIRVVTIAPGTFNTPILGGLKPEMLEALGKGVPFPSRLGNPQELAALAKAIVEIPYINGETIRLDGANRMAAK